MIVPKLSKSIIILAAAVTLLSLVVNFRKPFISEPGKINGASTADQVFSFGDRNKKLVALTFDADMTPHMETMLKSGQVKSWYNSKVVDILKENNVSATIFLTGMWASLYPDAVKQFSLNLLFELGNHSYSHPGFSVRCYNLQVLKDTVQKAKEISQTQEILEHLTGKSPTLFRFPGGCYAKDDLSLVKSLGMTVVGWDVSSTDAFNNDALKIVNHVISSVKNGSVVVFHLQGGLNAPKTAEVLPQVINRLKKKGFSFVKVSDLMKK